MEQKIRNIEVKNGKNSAYNIEIHSIIQKDISSTKTTWNNSFIFFQLKCAKTKCIEFLQRSCQNGLHAYSIWFIFTNKHVHFPIRQIRT